MGVRWSVAATLAAAVLVGSAGCSSGRAHRSSNGSAPTTGAPATAAPTSTTLDLGASAPTIPIGGTGVSCAEAVQSHDPSVLLAAYRAARIAGHGAEGCLTAEAAGSYAQGATDDDLLKSPGPMCLYRCGHYKVEDVVLSGSPSSPKGAGIDAIFEIHLHDVGGATQTTYSGPLYEYITIAPGTVASSRVKAAARTRAVIASGRTVIGASGVRAVRVRAC